MGKDRDGQTETAKEVSSKLKICSNLFVQLPLVDADFLGSFLQGVLEEGDILLVFLALNDDLLQGALLLAEDLDGFRVPPLLLVQFQLHILDASLQFADDALSTDDSIGLNFLQADGNVLKESHNINKRKRATN